jgi:phage tail sheath protein FI
MPVAVSFPGVYIQEVPSGVHTITGVSTSIAAFFGRTAQGYINRAVRCLSFADFLREFGGPHPLSDLGASVRQFFDNGGTDCYVVRLAHFAPGVSGLASVTLKNIEAGVQSKRVLTVTAKQPGLWGQSVRLEIDYNTPNPDDTFNMVVIQESGTGAIVSREEFSNLSMMPTSPRFAPPFVTQSSKLVDVTLHADMGDPASVASWINAHSPAGYSQGRVPFLGTPAAVKGALNTLLTTKKNKFVMNVNGTKDVNVDLSGAPPLTGASYQEVADSFADLLNTTLISENVGSRVKCSWDNMGNGKVLRITADDATGDFSSVHIRRATTDDLAAPLMLGLDQGGIEVVRYSNMRPVFDGSVWVGGPAFGDFTDGANVNSVNGFGGLLQDGVKAIQILDGSPPVPVDLVTTVDTDPMFISAGGGTDGVREKLRIIAQAVNADPNVPWKAELWGYHLAFRKKSGGVNDLSAVRITDAANAQVMPTSFSPNVRQYSLGAVGSLFASDGIPGVDGTAPDFADYIGDPLTHTGFNALDKVDLFNLMVLPGDREILEPTLRQLIGPASVYCNQHRAFLLLDAPASWTTVDIPVADASAVNSFRALVVKDHSAVFYPKVQYSDAGLKKLIGPTGMIAGLIARTDSQRGVWKAPAGTEAALFSVLDLEVNLTDLENGVLNKLGVNCLRKFPTGIVNWGARTLDGSDDIGSEWKYIPIRRLALFLEESLFRGTKWVVFEPNDEPLWASIRLNLNAFMLSLFRQGAFQGSTPDKAFYVKCDGETTTQNDRNLGIVNIEVGFAPLKPAEFVIIKIQQIAGDLT